MSTGKRSARKAEVSPYLTRPIRTYEEYIRERERAEEQARQTYDSVAARLRAEPAPERHGSENRQNALIEER